MAKPSGMLCRGIHHQMLNARPKYIQREAKVIAQVLALLDTCMQISTCTSMYHTHHTVLSLLLIKLALLKLPPGMCVSRKLDVSRSPLS